MRIFVDADACPVKGLIVQAAKARGLAVFMVCDTAHQLQDGYSQVIVVDQGSDSADYALVNRLLPRDVAVTQDYGVAAMALAKGAFAINQNGLLYTPENIDFLLDDRYAAAKARRSGKRTSGPKRRTRQDDLQFLKAFEALLDRNMI